MDMDTSKDSWNACLQYRNKQLTKQLKDVVSPSKAFLWHN